MTAPAAVAGLHDPRRPPTADDVARLVGAVTAGRAVGSRAATASYLQGPLAVAWSVGPHVSGTGAGERFTLIDGPVWSALPGGDPVGDAGSGQLDRALDIIRGDFALVVFDQATGDGTLARDHFGSYSLVWHERDGRLLFASEVSQLLPLLHATPTVDLTTMAHWLGISGMPGDRTLFDGVRRVSPAHRVDFGSGTPRARRYWSLRYRRPARIDRADAAAGIRRTLEDAIRHRCVDGTGVMLSGGLDSSSVTAVATALDDARPQHAYSAIFPDHPSVDESERIEGLCDAFDLRWTVVSVRSGSVLLGAVDYMRRWALPPASPNVFFWIPLLAQAAANGNHVLLDGEGGDEVFGLSPYLLADYVRRGRVRAANRLIRRIPGWQPNTPKESAQMFMRTFGIRGALPPSWQEARRRRRPPSDYTPSWMAPHVATAFLESDDPQGWKRLDAPRWWAFLADALTSMGPTMVHDHVRQRAAMAGDVAMRHPIRDVEVIEHVVGLPPELAFDPRWSRPLLRDAVADLLPDETRLRPSKSFFDAVFHESLAGRDLDVARALLSPREAAVGEFVDINAVQTSLLASAPEPPQRTQWAIEVWRLVGAECWLRLCAGTLDDTLAALPLPDPAIDIVQRR